MPLNDIIHHPNRMAVAQDAQQALIHLLETMFEFGIRKTINKATAKYNIIHITPN